MWPWSRGHFLSTKCLAALSPRRGLQPSPPDLGVVLCIRAGPQSPPCLPTPGRLGGRPGLGKEGRAPGPVSNPNHGPLCRLPPHCLGLTRSIQAHFHLLEPHGLGPDVASSRLQGCAGALQGPRGCSGPLGPVAGSAPWSQVPVPREPRGSHAVTRKKTPSWPRPRLGSSGFTTWLPAPEAGAGDRQARPSGAGHHRSPKTIPGAQQGGVQGRPSSWGWEVPGLEVASF